MSILLGVSFFIAGLLVMASCLVWGGRLAAGLRGIDLGVPNRFTVKADAASLLLVLGFLIAMIGPIFWYLNYDQRLQDLQRELNKTNGSVEEMRAQLSAFKAYDLKVRLKFPKDDITDLFSIKIVEICIRKGGMQVPACVSQQPSVQGNTLVVDLRTQQGETVRVVARHPTEGNIEWVSEDNPMPITVLELTKRTRSQ